MSVKIPILIDNASFDSDEAEEQRLDGARATELSIKQGKAYLSSIIAHWKMNDDAADTDVADSSGNGKDGTLQGGDNTEDLSESGKINNAFHFNGSDDYVLIGDDDDFSFGDGADDSPFSVSFLVKVDDHTSTHYIISKHAWDDNGHKEWHVVLIGGASGASIACRLYDASTGGYIGRRNSGVSITTANGWVHFVVTYDGSGASSGIKIYRNTVQHDNSDWASGSYTAMENTATPVRIGCVGDSVDGSPSSFIDGYIDELRVYGAVLSSQNIDDLYNSGSGTEDPLEIEYPSAAEAILETLDSTGEQSTWDMSSVEVFENPNSEGGSIKYQYAYGDSDDPTNWNGTWLTKAQLQSQSDVLGRYFRVKVQFVSDGSQDATISDGYINCDVRLGPMLAMIGG